uniref:Uncharacterized protein n=1 Tax=Oryza punctata TaxID=4537 RepID=A0A0E0K026_ORYPU
MAHPAAVPPQCQVHAEWFLHGVLSRGIDFIDDNLFASGPPPPARIRSPLTSTPPRSSPSSGGGTHQAMFAAQSMGGFPCPAINLSNAVFAAVMDEAMATHLDPSFDAYASSVNFLLASYILPHITAFIVVGIITIVIYTFIQSLYICI